MSERLPEQTSLDDYRLHGRSLQQWHQWLTTDPETGEDQRHLRTFSSYGSTSDDCAYWAIAAELVYTAEYGENSDDDCLLLLIAISTAVRVSTSIQPASCLLVRARNICSIVRFILSVAPSV